MPQNPDRPFRVIQSMAVVSPCSQCKAFSAEPGSGTLCPRLYWLDVDKASKENGLDSTPDYLLVSGTDDPEKLANPVYNKTNLSVLVWIALLENNEARIMDGELKTVDILSPGFDTRYIQCLGPLRAGRHLGAADGHRHVTLSPRSQNQNRRTLCLAGNRDP